MWKMLYKSVIFKLLTGIILIILPINVLMILSSRLLVDASRRHIMSEMENSLNVYMDKLDGELHHTEEFLIRLKNNDNYLNVLNGDGGAQSQYDYVRALTRLKLDFTDYMEATDFIGGIAIDFTDRAIFIGQDRNGNMDSHIRAVIGEGNAEDIRWGIRILGGQRYLLRTIRHPDDCVYVWMRLDDVQKYFRQIDQDGASLYLLSDEKGQGSGDGMAAQKDDLIVISSKLVSVALGRTMNNNGLELLPVVTVILEILSVIALCAIPLLILMLWHQVIRPISRLTSAIAHVKSGDMDYRIGKISTSNEFDQINDSFNSMMDQIQRLKVGVYEEKIEKQKIRLEYLSHQVQPHFVLNTLNILYCYRQEEYPLMRRMIKYLMKYFRYIVKVNSNYVTIRQELEHIQNYLEIQKIRYPDCFYYYIECEPEIDNCLLPPLIVQNFVENAIKNSISLDYKINLFILVQQVAGDRLRIRVADTGKGFEAGVLDEIGEFKKSHQPQPHLGVGLQNAILRLDILYHGIPELNIYNSPAGGATVDILLPKITEE